VKDKLKRLVRHLSAWAWADEIETTKQAGGVLRWKSEYDWWHWYVVEVGTKGGHQIGSHADPMVRKAWDAARERMPNTGSHRPSEQRERWFGVSNGSMTLKGKT